MAQSIYKEKGVRLGLLILASAVAAIVTMLVMTYVGFSLHEAFYVAFTMGSTVAAIIAMTQREVNIGTVAAFAALILVMAFLSPYLGFSSAVVFKTAAGEIVIYTEYIPWIALGVIAFFVAMAFLGADVTRMGLWTLGTLLTLMFYSVTDATVKILISTMVALIVAIPLLQEQPSRRAPYFLAAAPIVGARKAVVVDLTTVNAYTMAFMPLLMFIALDPFRLIKRRIYRDLAAVLVLFVVFLQVLDVFI